MSEKLGSLNAWMTFAANVGVLLGIIFLVWEIRTNTAAIQAASSQSVTNASLEGLRLQASDVELSRVRQKGDKDFASLSEDEAWRYHLYYRSHWLAFQNNFFQRNINVLGQDVWDTYARIICSDMKRPGVAASWQNHSIVLNPDFVAFVDTCPR